MSTIEMNSDFAGGVRAELAAIGTKSSRLQRYQRRSRALALGIGALVLAGATTGAAVVVNSLPGTTTVIPLGSVVTTTHTGTGRLDLGSAPTGAAVVVIDLTCVSDVGTISLPLDPNGSEHADGLETDCAIAHRTIHITDGRLPAGGTTSITITADPGTTWRASAQYAASSTTAWGVNAHGQTYGVLDGRPGMPDLQAAQATNGKQGYVLTKDLMAMDHDGYLDVYESDGTTIIGKFPIGNVDGYGYTVTTDAPTDGAGK